MHVRFRCAVSLCVFLPSSIYKRRRCFVWKHHYFQLDIFVDPSPSVCRGLVLLETYTADSSPNFLRLPSFLTILREVTGDPSYSMYNLCLMDEYRGSNATSASNGGYDEFSRSEANVDALRRRAKSETGAEFSAAINLALNQPIERDGRYSGKTISASSASSLNSASSEDATSDQDGEEVFENSRDRSLSRELEIVMQEGTSQDGQIQPPSEPFHPSDALLAIEVRNGNGMSHRPRHLSSSFPRSSSLPPNNCIKQNHEHQEMRD